MVKFFPDQKTINRIRSNDRAVLGELFLRHRKMVFNYVITHGGSETDAEDVLQEAIIVLWQKACTQSFELTAKLSTYVMAVAKNKWMAEMRKRKKISDEELPLDLSDGRLSALDNVIESEESKRVQRGLQSLGEVCRELLILFYFEERSFKDIARIMGFAGPDVAKSKKYQCKKGLELALRKLSSKKVL